MVDRRRVAPSEGTDAHIDHLLAYKFWPADHVIEKELLHNGMVDINRVDLNSLDLVSGYYQSLSFVRRCRHLEALFVLLFRAEQQDS